MQALLLSTLLLGAAAQANDVTYRKDIRPLWEKQCMACHDASSPSLAEFDENKDKHKARSRGPRMDSYPHLVSFVGWPDSGALMRRLDDGKHTQDGKPGNMYRHLGSDEAERQKNLALFKAWVGEDGWVLKRFKELTREELGEMKVEE
ncbi:MAG: cytochrome C [Betaproteobacteria bacterium HGW-Betaproteobacteria-17]|nr:MAG: cytochrome C [Betaproteobacteria bacterium HGW-Betaproteobacteria-17]